MSALGPAHTEEVGVLTFSVIHAEPVGRSLWVFLWACRQSVHYWVVLGYLSAKEVHAKGSPRAETIEPEHEPNGDARSPKVRPPQATAIPEATAPPPPLPKTIIPGYMYSRARRHQMPGHLWNMEARERFQILHPGRRFRKRRDSDASQGF